MVFTALSLLMNITSSCMCECDLGLTEHPVGVVAHGAIRPIHSFLLSLFPYLFLPQKIKSFRRKENTSQFSQSQKLFVSWKLASLLETRKAHLLLFLSLSKGFVKPQHPGWSIAISSVTVSLFCHPVMEQLVLTQNSAGEVHVVWLRQVRRVVMLVIAWHRKAKMGFRNRL